MLVCIEGKIPEIVAGSNPVEQGKGCDSTEEGCDAAKAIADIAHEAALRAHVLHLTELEREPPARAHHPAIDARHHRFDAKQRDAGDAEPKGTEQQHDKGVAQLVQHHARRIQPEPEESSSFPHEPVADLIDAPAQPLPRDAQQDEEYEHRRNYQPGLVRRYLRHKLCINKHFFAARDIAYSPPSRASIVNATAQFSQWHDIPAA